MNGWEIACVIVGIITVIGATEKTEVFIGALLTVLPLYFNFWRG